ncbi:hypothetical protein E1258_19705 [Micromonospora sp. KC207]|uniref:hypothetical protein n=1 Tax=Micromonospora sp. KC207 TaxID=2530377 RepID=UPI001048DFB5|nr:hypothetical protein [Micromonospora sp. KC207]TDC58958.1 hypothetical protein E1258_19705 [Micromonospora sp. KC207]
MTAPEPDDLPFVDEHRMPVAAPPAVVWPALTRQVTGPRFAASETFARLLAAEPARSSRTPVVTGATLVGFRVADAQAERLLRLTGRHRFSRYELRLALAEVDDGTVVSARTYAAFHGLHGAAYRMLVIGSGAHVIAVRRLLHAVRKDSEGR